MTLRDLMAPVIRGDLFYATRPRGARLPVDPDGKARDMRSEAEAAAWAQRRSVPISWIPQAARVLDVGCGDGKLKVARPDLDVVGYEPSDEDREAAQRRGVHTVEASDHAGIYFDVLFCMDVVEHMSDPRGDLAVWMRSLRTGGLVIVECPDFWSPMAQLYGDRYRLLHDPDHVSLFTTESLIRMLRDLGVIVEDVAFPFYGGPFDTAETWERHEIAHVHSDSTISPASPGNMVAVRGRKR